MSKQNKTTSFSKLKNKMFRNRSKSGDRTKRQSSKEREKAEHFMTDYDLSNVCNHMEALMNSSRFGNTELLYKLYSHHIDLRMTDESGNNAMHVAVMNTQHKIMRMLVVLCAPAQIWKVKNNNGLTAVDLCVDDKIKDDFNTLERVKPIVSIGFENVDQTCNDLLYESKTHWEENERVLLALDGGGIRACITVQMLIHIDHLLDGKLVEKIDDLAGTSCGGVIALLLSTNNRNIEETRKLLLDMRERVFSKQHGKGVWPKYSSSGMEYIAKHITTWEDSKMDTIKRHRTMVTVADTRMVPPQLLMFRSYCPDMPEEAREHYKFFDPSKVELWKALRCTTAAPYFFDSFNNLSDGGLIANNPTLALISDHFLTNKLDKAFAKTEEERASKGNWKIGCVLSLGTGVFPTEKIDGIDLNIPHTKNPLNFAKSFYKAINNTRNLFQVLVKECTASNGQPVKYAREWCHSIGTPYFRFTPHLSQGISLDETDLGKIMQVMWETELYVAANRPAFEKLARFLSSKPARKYGNDDKSSRIEDSDTSEVNSSSYTTQTTTVTTRSTITNDNNTTTTTL